MADNTIINPGTAGDTIRDIDRGSAKTQVVALDAGGESAESLVSATNPLPVSDPVVAAAQTSDAPLVVNLVGDPNGDFAGLNLLEQVIDPNTGIAVSVNSINPGKRDVQGAAIPSDAVGPFTCFISAVANPGPVIDTTGYASMHLTSAGTCNIQASNDLAVWTAIALSTGGAQTASNVATVIPCLAKYIRFTFSNVAGVVTWYLRAAPAALGNASTGLTQWGGSGVAVGAASGQPAIGGLVATGSAAGTAFPIVVAGVDSGALVRRVLTDTSGRLQVVENGTDAQGVNRPIGVAYPTEGAQASLMVQDTSVQDGLSQMELLAQILLELQIMNQQHYTLNEMLAAQCNVPKGDEPAAFRNDPSVFN